MSKIITIVCLLLTSCATKEVIKYKYLIPPSQLVQAVVKPQKPSFSTATQKTVAIYLIELSYAFDNYDNQMLVLREWIDKINKEQIKEK